VHVLTNGNGVPFDLCDCTGAVLKVETAAMSSRDTFRGRFAWFLAGHFLIPRNASPPDPAIGRAVYSMMM
jgi:hypothetical protein